MLPSCSTASDGQGRKGEVGEQVGGEGGGGGRGGERERRKGEWGRGRRTGMGRGKGKGRRGGGNIRGEREAAHSLYPKVGLFPSPSYESPCR